MFGRDMTKRNSHVVQSNKILNILILIRALKLIGSVIVQAASNSNVFLIILILKHNGFNLSFL